MSQQKFRPFEFMRYYIEEAAHGEQINKSEQTINLHDVKAYRKFIFTGFEDEVSGKEFTHLEVYGGDNYIALMSYEEFRGMFNEFLLDTGDLDPRTTRKYPLKNGK